MTTYYSEIDKDWSNIQKKIEEWKQIPESTLLYDEVLRAFQKMQLKGKMTPLIRKEYVKIAEPKDIYIQPGPDLKYQTSKPVSEREGDLLQLTLRLMPVTYHPVVLSYETVSLAVLTWLTSIDIETFSKWCTSNVCPCCLERLMSMWNEMFVNDIDRLVNEIKAVISPMCGKQKAHYLRLIHGLVRRGKLQALVKTRISLCNEILFLGLKIKN